MKRLFLLILLGFSLSQLRAEETAGTLTLEKDKVVFRANGAEQSYNAMAVPGLKSVEYTPKMTVKDDKETAVSELLLELPAGGQIKLVMSKPLEVVRITNGSSTEWKFKEK